jgi:amidophosphoribosyltransferase
MLSDRCGQGLEDAIAETMPLLQGAYSFVVMDEKTVFGVRDPYGVRPLVIGRLPAGGWVVTSETCALDIVGASYVRDVEPGEIVAIDENGLRSRVFAKPDSKLCIFEYVYLARPDSNMYDRNVHEVRRELGRLLAAESPADADLVIGVPDTGPVAAAGFAEASGIPYGEGIVKNRYVGRTFIQPTQTIRQLGIRLKLNPLKQTINGKRLVVVDDSIVRGNTTRQIVGMLRESGAREVHLRITSPPIRWPCFYGIDMATKSELVASDLTIEEIRSYVGADSLAYLSLPSLVRATGSSSDKFCRACFDGIYPIPVPEDELEPKFVLEERTAQRE